MFMGIHRDSNLYSLFGAKDFVKTYTTYVASTFSRWSTPTKPIRSYNEQTKELEHTPIEAVYTYPEGVRMWKLKTEDNYMIELTEDSEVFTIDGWRVVSDIKEGDVILSNGTDKPPYADKDILEKLYVYKGKSQKEIGDMYGVSARTIRLYVHRFNLQRGDAGAQFGKDNPNWKGELVTKDGGYSRTERMLGEIRKGVCNRCGFEGKTDIHHDDRNPVNNSDENLIELCMMCHKSEHHGATVRWLRPATVVEVIYAGHAKTYGFRTSNGNVVANGFIVRFNESSAVIREIGAI